MESHEAFANHSTLEYDLAYAGLAKELLVAARLAADDDALNMSRTASKAITAQYLVDLLEDCLQRQVLSHEQIMGWLAGHQFNIIYIMRTFVWSRRGRGWADLKPAPGINHWA